MVNRTNNYRDISIDAARGIALFMVVLSHACHVSHYLTDFYIVAFFFLSGLLYKPGRSYSENITKKSLRVLAPYFVNSLILLAIFAFFKSFSLEYLKNALFGIIYSRNVIIPGDSTIMISGNPPLWYLTAFFVTSLLFHLIVDRFTCNWRSCILSILLLLSASILLATIPILLPWSFDMVPFFTIAMVLGYLFKKYYSSYSSGVKQKLLITCLLVFSYVSLCYDNGAVNLSVRNYGGGNYLHLL